MRQVPEFRWLEWGFDKAEDVEYACFCNLRYMVTLSTTQTKVHIFSDLSGHQLTENLSSFSHKAAISLALLAVPQEIVDSFTVCCSLDPEIFAIFLFLEGSRFFYYIWYFLIQPCNSSFCTGRLGEMKISESLASESCGK